MSRAGLPERRRGRRVYQRGGFERSSRRILHRRRQRAGSRGRHGIREIVVASAWQHADMVWAPRGDGGTARHPDAFTPDVPVFTLPFVPWD
jgi:hypothetical protein